MKLKLTAILIAALALAGFEPAMASTNSVLGALSNITNYNASVTYGHSLTKNFHLVAADLEYNLNGNVAVVLGGDAIFSGFGRKDSHQFYLVNGGLQLQEPVQLFTWTGISWLKNVWLVPFAANLIGNPYKGSSSAVADKTVTGVGINLHDFGGGFNLALAGDYEVLTGTGKYDASYGMVTLCLAHNWPLPEPLALRTDHALTAMRHVLDPGQRF